MIKIQSLRLQEPHIHAAEDLILKIGDDPTITSMLTIFRTMWDNGQGTEELKQAKNSIIEFLTCEQMKANHGWFQPTRVWGEKTCRSCSGFGIIIKFQKAPEVQACSCDEGFIWKPCTSCKEGIFTKKNNVEVICRNCTPSKESYDLEPAYWDAHKGQRRTKCRKCLGAKVIQALPGKRKLLPSIESTTPCEICSGLGWVEPKQKPKPEGRNKGFNLLKDAAERAGLETN